MRSTGACEEYKTLPEVKNGSGPLAVGHAFPEAAPRGSGDGSGDGSPANFPASATLRALHAGPKRREISVLHIHDPQLMVRKFLQDVYGGRSGGPRTPLAQRPLR